MQVTVVVGADGEVEDVDAAASVSLAGWPAWATILPRFEAIRPPEVCRPSTGMAVRIAPPEKAQTNKQKSLSSSAASHTAYYSCNNNDPTPIVDKNLPRLILVASSW